MISKYAYCEGCTLYNAKHVLHKTHKEERVVILLPSPHVNGNGNDTYFNKILTYLPALLKDTRYKGVSPDQFDYLYAIECVCSRNPSEDDIKRCSQGLYTKLNNSGARVILALGDISRQSLQFGGSVYHLAKQHLTFSRLDHQYSVVFGYEPSTGNHIDRSIRHALNILRINTPVEVLTQQHRFPNTVENIAQTCKLIKERIRTPLSISIVTNTHRSYLSHAKILAFGISWDQNKGVGFLFDHASAPFTADDLIPIIKPFLESNQPKIVHNYKDVHKFLNKYHIQINNIAHDTAYIEHLIHEAQEHSFTLWDLMEYYTPEFNQYKTILQQELDQQAVKREEMFLELKAPMPTITEYGEWIAAMGLTEVTNILELKESAANVLKKCPPFLKKSVKTLQNKIKPKISAWKKKRNAEDLQKELQTSKSLDQLSTLEHVRIELLVRHASTSAESIHLITKEQELLLKNEKKDHLYKLLRDVYFTTAEVFSEIEHTGINIDTQYLYDIAHNVYRQSTELAEKIFAIIGYQFNLKSNPELTQALQHKFSLNINTNTRSGLADLSKESLERFIQSDTPQEAKQCLSYIQQLRSIEHTNYIIEDIQWYATHIGRVHYSVNLCGASSGRTSTSNINIQGLPGAPIHHFNCPGEQDCSCVPINIKKLIIPDHPEHVIMTIDVAGAEIRVMMAYAPDEKLIKAIQDGLDVHCWLASFVLGVPYQDKSTGMTDEFQIMRKAVKAILYGTFYGMTKYGLSRKIGASIEKSQRIMNEVMLIVPSLKDYQERCKKSVRDNGYIETFFGRRRRFNLSTCKDQHEEWAIYRQAFNFPPQSTTHELLSYQLKTLNTSLRAHQGRFLFERHDEFAFTLPQVSVPIASNIVRDIITKQISVKFKWLPLPFVVEIKTGPSFGELKPIT